jgi:hypothetical protein
MTQDEIMEMARQAASHGVEDHRSGEISYVFYNEHLMNFAKLVAAKEREACAKLCEGRIQEGLDFEGCSKAIRARGTE